MEAMLLNGHKSAHAGFPGDLVSLARVHKRYGVGMGSVHALDDIDLQVATGEMVVVCGPCGSGKTSLLNIVGMLETANEGNVVIASLLVSRLSEQARADLRDEMIGFVFQAFSLIPAMTARDNVLLPLLLRGHMEPAELAVARERAACLLSQLGLATQSGQYPARLDASQRQRVAIARALITRPRLVLADEPLSRLDSVCIRQVMEVFARQQQEHGTAFLISTRDQRQLSRANRTLQLNDGRLPGVSGDGGRRPLRVQP
jgi:ABC-type lipoprotein export system ATPase subunit